jgi:hypothetical protein
MPGGGPVNLPGQTTRGPVSLPGATSSGPVTLPGAPRPDGPVLVSGLPTNRTDFPSREAALQRARELVRVLILNDMEEIDRAQIFGTPEEQGLVIYYRGRGSTAEFRGAEPRGNIVAIVEHTADPTQPPHFHVVRPPTTGSRIEHGGVYNQPFAGTPDEHLTVRSDTAVNTSAVGSGSGTARGR